jgi:hypothetical protein
MDVAKIMQLYLQKEITGTSNISENIRWLYLLFCSEGKRVGFDKPQLETKAPPVGVLLWLVLGILDLREQWLGQIRNRNRIYLLIHRTFPGDSTNKLSRENIREDIQEIIYDAIER